MRYLFAFLLVTLVQTFGFSLEKDYVFERISPEAGFAFDAVYSVIEDENGFIWFGCNNGLYYYNTTDIISFNFDPQREDTPQSNKINKLYRDIQNRIWVCTENGICYFNPTTNSFVRLNLKEIKNYQKYIFALSMVQYSENEYLAIINNSIYRFNLDDQILVPVRIETQETKVSFSYIGKGNDGQIYAGTTQGEVYLNDSPDLRFRSIYHSKQAVVRSIAYINSQIWIGYDNEGIDIISPKGLLISSYRHEFSGERQLPNNRVRKIIQRKNGDIWVGTYDGIYIISSSGNRTIKESTYNQLPHKSIYDIFIDNNEGIWLGTWAGGLAYYSDYNFRFEHVQKFTNLLNTPRSVISSFADSPNGTIWVGSESLGLNEYNPNTKSFNLSPVKTKDIPALHIKALATDKKNRLWIGTFNEGLWYMNNNGDKQLRQVKNSQSSMYIITTITPVDSGVWVGTRDGLIFYNPENDSRKFFHYAELKIGSISSDKIWKSFEDSKGNLWFCTDFGLSIKQKGSNDFERFFQNENTGSLSRNIIYSIGEDSSGKIWIGTNGGGIDIYDPEKKTFEKFDQNESLNKADIYSIIKDRQNNMWFSSDLGIHVYLFQTKTLKSFDLQDGLQGLQFNPNSAFISSSGLIYWGGSNGFNSINPATISINTTAPAAFISKFLINNLPFNEQKLRSINSYHLAKLNQIELNYNQNSLGFSFVANNFIKSTKNKFRYRLKNYQDEWTETSSGKDIAFTKVPSGKYILEVFASNNDGVWNKEPYQLFIKIYPPVLLSWYAYLVYFILLGVIIYIIIREIIFREKARKELISEKFKNDAAELLFSEKTKFFTNISHEFRTPLTLIISPVNNLMKKFKSEPNTYENLKSVKRNADRLLRLTNQILDFRLLELNKIELKPENTDVVNLCKEICECFDYQIAEKEINFMFSSAYKSLMIPIDADKIEKTIYNLLSNALKFSPEKGQIILSVEERELTKDYYAENFFTGKKYLGQSLEIKVKDFGNGILPEMIPNIFDRFFINPDNKKTGTGIGLHLCQEYIRLHNGNIMITSELGKGTVFTINLPLANISDFEKENLIIQPTFDKLSEIIPAQSDFNPTHKNKVILLAEDNDELRIYLKNFLMGGFKIVTAKNGSQAFEIAQELIPDLIISDVLMPGMDGMELTSKIRKNSQTNHIPIILLTALSGQNTHIEGLSRGADLFLTKPIDESLLLAQIETMLANRFNLIEKYGQNATSDTKLSFLEQAEKYVLANIRNSQLDINMLASELNISRTSLHRKIKSKTNQSATEFIRDIRLKNAVILLKESKYNMDEIAVLVGFNSASYFNRSFKQKYGKTPKEYQNL